jgi:Fur family transcriptional regulator, ferric uptake regulator
VNAADRSPSPYGSGRVTPQRRLIASTASRMHGAFSIDELAAAVKADDATTGAATVYRAVSALLTSGWLERVGERDGSALFARCHAGGSHHHHVVCDGCGRVEATPCPVISDSLAAESPASAAGGFVITRHEVTLYGLCPSCAEKNAHEPCVGKPRAR